LYTGYVWVKASGSGKGCIAEADNEWIEVDDQEVVVIYTEYEMYAPGSSDHAYVWQYVWYPEKYTSGQHTGSDEETGYLVRALTVDEDSAAYIQTRSKGTDWNGWTITCDETSDLKYIYFD
jgi:hypothetical protein